MKDIVIVDAVRSAVGRALKGTLAQKRPDEMAGEVIRGLLARNPKVEAAALIEIEHLVDREGGFLVADVGERAAVAHDR